MTRMAQNKNDSKNSLLQHGRVEICKTTNS